MAHRIRYPVKKAHGAIQRPTVLNGSGGITRWTSADVAALERARGLIAGAVLLEGFGPRDCAKGAAAVDEHSPKQAPADYQSATGTIEPFWRELGRATFRKTSRMKSRGDAMTRRRPYKNN